MKVVRFAEGVEHPFWGQDWRAFAYDSVQDIVYTTTGHHPDIVMELYQTQGLSYEETRNHFERAMKEYLWGWTQRGVGIERQSGNLQSQEVLVSKEKIDEIYQTIWETNELPQRYDNWSGLGTRFAHKIAGDLTNGFVYYNGKLAVDNVPHPVIIRKHFPGIINLGSIIDDLQAGLIYEENGRIHPVFHSYTLTSQEKRREALKALEEHYMRPIDEELDYSEAMNRLSKIADYNGWTNWDTWNAALMQDNDHTTFDMARDFANRNDYHGWKQWLLESIIGPSNASQIQDAQEWNDIPEAERIDYHYEDLKERNEQAADIVNQLGFGPDVSDYTPDLIDAELINYDEIWQHMRDEMGLEDDDETLTIPTHWSKTVNTPIEWLECDSQHELGLPFFVLQGQLWMGLNEGYHTTLFSSLWDATGGGFTTTILAGRVDKNGDVWFYDFTTGEEGEYNPDDINLEKEQAMIELANHWPEIEQRLQEVGTGKELNRWGLVNHNIKQLLEGHTGKIAATVQYVDHPVTKEWGWNSDAHAIIYDPENQQVWIGPPNSSHAELLQAIKGDLGTYIKPGEYMVRGRGFGYHHWRARNLNSGFYEGYFDALNGPEPPYYILQEIKNAIQSHKTAAVSDWDLIEMPIRGFSRDDTHSTPAILINPDSKTIYMSSSPGMHFELWEAMTRAKVYWESEWDWVAAWINDGRDERYENDVVRFGTGEEALIDDEKQEIQELFASRLNRTAASGADMEGSMIGLWLPINIAQAIEMEGGESAEGMHITLCYFVEKANERDDWWRVQDIVAEYSQRLRPLTGLITEYGTFDNPDGTVLWVKPEIVGLEKIQADLMHYCDTAGFEVSKKFDFNPHITIAYDWQGDIPTLEQPIPVTFDELTFAQGMNRVEYPLGMVKASDFPDVNFEDDFEQDSPWKYEGSFIWSPETGLLFDPDSTHTGMILNWLEEQGIDLEFQKYLNKIKGSMAPGWIFFDTRDDSLIAVPVSIAHSGIKNFIPNAIEALQEQFPGITWSEPQEGMNQFDVPVYDALRSGWSKVSTLYNHSASWIYFPEKDELWIGYTHPDIMTHPDFPFDMNNLYNWEWEGPQMVLGQIGKEGNIGFYSDVSRLDDRQLADNTHAELKANAKARATELLNLAYQEIPDIRLGLRHDQRENPFIYHGMQRVAATLFKWYYLPETDELNVWQINQQDGRPSHLEMLMGENYRDEWQNFPPRFIAGDNDGEYFNQGVDDQDIERAYQLLAERGYPVGNKYNRLGVGWRRVEEGV